MARPTLVEAAQRKSDKENVLLSLDEMGSALGGFEAPEIKWVCENVLANETCTLIFAKSGHQKSLFTLDLMRSIASGEKFLGQTTNKNKCLYFDGEMSAKNIYERVATMQISNIPKSDFNYIATYKLINNDLNLAKANVRNQLLTMIKASEYNIVVFDNIRTLLRLESENSATEFSDFNDFIKKIRGMGKTVLVVHHANKELSDENRATYAGSSNIETVYDILISLIADDCGNLTVHVDKDRSNDIKEFLDKKIVRFVEPTGYENLTYDLIDADMQKDRLKLAKTMISILKTQPAECRDSKNLFMLCRDQGVNVKTPRLLGWQSIYDNYVAEIHPEYTTFKSFNTQRKEWCHSHNQRLMEQVDSEDEQAMFN